MDKAIEIPIDKAGLSVNVGRDGVWLYFQSNDGKHAGFHVESLERGALIGAAIKSWIKDRIKQAEELKA